ncbi:hypothetical protein RND81_06G229300 [Saponaria officinalis]|uniref:Uncharacterized protein n=1 Tax=Saponaria officinalis TaxID=3572 RepID=A0AAW1K9S9_SAPOF
MGFHLLAIANLKLAKAATHGCTPLVLSLILPFILRMSCSVRIIRQSYIDLFYSSRLFMFQLTQIVLDDNNNSNNNNNNIEGSNDNRVGSRDISRGGARWDRALRLVSERLIRTRRHLASMRYDDDDEVSFHDFSMIAL